MVGKKSFHSLFYKLLVAKIELLIITNNLKILIFKLITPVINND